MSDAKKVKIVSCLMMVASVPGCGIAATTNSNVIMGISGILFFGGLLGFVIGRFME
jgi:hypothetical protein